MLPCSYPELTLITTDRHGGGRLKSRLKGLACCASPAAHAPPRHPPARVAQNRSPAGSRWDTVWESATADFVAAGPTGAV